MDTKLPSNNNVMSPGTQKGSALVHDSPSTRGEDGVDLERLCERGRDVIDIEIEAVKSIRNSVDARFAQACLAILGCAGRLVVSGMGKSGHIASKLAATFASTGTPAFFVHPAEASHGDLGMITRDDVFLCLSNSGTTEELVSIVPLIKREGATLIAMTGNPASRLAQLADIHLNAAVAREACPMNLAPTASTTAALALGDAIAVAVLDAREFGENDFARSHPGGKLGKRLLTRVSDLMHTGSSLPSVSPQARLSDAIVEMTRKRLGMTAVCGADNKVVGIITDGDLRRLLTRGDDVRGLSATDSMTHNPTTIKPDALAAQAAHLMQERGIGQLLAVDDAGRLQGALNFQDLLAAKII